MDEGMAGIYKQFFEENSENLRVIKTISIFHSLRQSIERYDPDIVYLVMNRVHYDRKDHKKAVLDTVYNLKTDSQFAHLRIAIQTNLNPHDPFLKDLATHGIYDIFNLQGQNGHLDLYSTVNQLSEPANLGNVSQYLSLNDQVVSPKTPEASKKPQSEANKTSRTLREPPQNDNKIAHKKKRVLPKPNREKAINTEELTSQLRGRRKLKKERHRSRQKRVVKPRRSHRGVIVVVLLVIVIISGSLGFLRSCGNETVKTTQPYSQLISQKKYSEAAQSYPSKAVQTENTMLNDSGVKDKAGVSAEVSQYSDDDAIKFDNAYFDGQFKKAIRIYSRSTNNNLLHLNKSRKTMLAYSYMKAGRVNDAKRLAKQLNNRQLNQKIIAYGKFQEANNILEKKIKSGQLNSSDIKKAKKQIKVNKQAMNKL